MLVRKKSLGLCADTSDEIHSIQQFPGKRLPIGMNRWELHSLNGQFNGDDEAVLQVERYLVNHPGSPSAVRRPKVFRQGDTFIVLLGRDVQHGIVGLGNTVENALRAFDFQYCNALPPSEPRSVTAKARAYGRK